MCWSHMHRESKGDRSCVRQLNNVVACAETSLMSILACAAHTGTSDWPQCCDKDSHVLQPPDILDHAAMAQVVGA